MKERYGPQGGQIWEDGVWADFEDKDGPVTIPWYNEAGGKNIIAADENRPLQMATVEEYKDGILSDGLNQGSRGAPWMQWGPSKTFPVRALTWNHLKEAFYKAHAEQPDNPYVQIALKAGLKNGNRRKGLLRTPRNVVEFMCNRHNKYHKGSKTTFEQMMGVAVHAEAQWTGNKDGVDAYNPDYEKLYRKWVSENADEPMNNWPLFSSTKGLCHKLDRFDIQPQFRKWCNKHVRYLHEKLDHKGVLHIMNAIGVSVIKHMPPKARKKDTGIVFLEALALALPVRPSDEQRRLPWIIQSMDHVHLMSALGVDMTESVAFKQRQIEKEQAEKGGKEGSKTKAGKGKQRKSGSSKPPPAKKAKTTAGQGKGSKFTFFSEIIDMLQVGTDAFIAENCESSKLDATLSQDLDMIYHKTTSYSLEFACNGIVTIHKEIKAWSVCKGALLGMYTSKATKKDYSEDAEMSEGVQPVVDDGEKDEKDESMDGGANQNPDENELVSLLAGDKEVCDRLTGILSDIAGEVPFPYHREIRKATDQIQDIKAKLVSSTTLPTFLSAWSEVLFSILPEKMIHIINRLSVHDPNGQYIPAIKDEASLEHALSLRPLYMMQALVAALDAGAIPAGPTFKSLIDLVSDIKINAKGTARECSIDSAIVAFDLNLDTKETWVQKWVEVVTMASSMDQLTRIVNEKVDDKEQEAKPEEKEMETEQTVDIVEAEPEAPQIAQVSLEHIMGLEDPSVSAAKESVDVLELGFNEKRNFTMTDVKVLENNISNLYWRRLAEKNYTWPKIVFRKAVGNKAATEVVALQRQMLDPNTFVMPYAGEVTCTPAKDGIPVCHVLGMQFFLVPGNTGSVASEAPVPAWIVKTVTRADAATMVRHDGTFTAYIDSNLNIFENKPEVQKLIQIEFADPVLKLKEGEELAKGDIVLTRTLTDTEKTQRATRKFLGGSLKDDGSVALPTVCDMIEDKLKAFADGGKGTTQSRESKDSKEAAAKFVDPKNFKHLLK
ncbi:unnamed protein product [Prorocentrum cordatum]|uniref:Uncharacterized protein n=1 Tax=Prorocentrum cordatum TaxID=2364126 RepID=A0ABN9Y9J2_9DINO|nr:unnamed protein product [Polarella glacialis]